MVLRPLQGYKVTRFGTSHFCAQNTDKPDTHGTRTATFNLRRFVQHSFETLRPLLAPGMLDVEPNDAGVFALSKMATCVGIWLVQLGHRPESVDLAPMGVVRLALGAGCVAQLKRVSESGQLSNKQYKRPEALVRSLFKDVANRMTRKRQRAASAADGDYAAKKACFGLPPAVSAARTELELLHAGLSVPFTPTDWLVDDVDKPLVVMHVPTGRGASSPSEAVSKFVMPEVVLRELQEEAVAKDVVFDARLWSVNDVSVRLENPEGGSRGSRGGRGGAPAVVREVKIVHVSDGRVFRNAHDAIRWVRVRDDAVHLGALHQEKLPAALEILRGAIGKLYAYAIDQRGMTEGGGFAQAEIREVSEDDEDSESVVGASNLEGHDDGGGDEDYDDVDDEMYDEMDDDGAGGAGGAGGAYLQMQVVLHAAAAAASAASEGDGERRQGVLFIGRRHTLLPADTVSTCRVRLDEVMAACGVQMQLLTVGRRRSEKKMVLQLCSLVAAGSLCVDRFTAMVGGCDPVAFIRAKLSDKAAAAECDALYECLDGMTHVVVFANEMAKGMRVVNSRTAAAAARASSCPESSQRAAVIAEDEDARICRDAILYAGGTIITGTMTDVVREVDYPMHVVLLDMMESMFCEDDLCVDEDGAMLVADDGETSASIGAHVEVMTAAAPGDYAEDADASEAAARAEENEASWLDVNENDVMLITERETEMNFLCDVACALEKRYPLTTVMDLMQPFHDVVMNEEGDTLTVQSRIQQLIAALPAEAPETADVLGAMQAALGKVPAGHALVQLRPGA